MIKNYDSEIISTICSLILGMLYLKNSRLIGFKMFNVSPLAVCSSTSDGITGVWGIDRAFSCDRKMMNTELLVEKWKDKTWDFRQL